jgi:hypothetical protein
MTSAAVLIVFALAVARVTTLVTSDRITRAPRERFLAWAWSRAWPNPEPSWQVVRAGGGDPPLLAYLIECPWCVSIYVAAVAAPLWYWLGTNPRVLVPAVALAFSYVTGFLAQHGE